MTIDNRLKRDAGFRGLAFILILLTGLTFASGEEDKKKEKSTENASEAVETTVASPDDEKKHSSGGHHSGLPDTPSKRIDSKRIDYRTPPLFEWPTRFLGNGNLPQGFKTPFGAVWQPYLVVFGNVRNSVHYFEPDNTVEDNEIAEWASSGNIFANLYLTFTERFLFGFQPLQQDGQFTGYDFRADSSNFRDHTNFNITTLFFEGDFGEIFPFLDPRDKGNWDFGVSVGRQLISFQEGLLINDNIDAVGVAIINLKPPTTINTRVTALYSWNEINRAAPPLFFLNDTLFAGGNYQDPDAQLFGLLTETDWRSRTVAFDALYVQGGDFSGDGLYLGLDAVQRTGKLNSSIRIVQSLPIGDETPFNQQGGIAFAEFSREPNGTYNHLYLNGYYGWKNFRSAARAPSAGGPLGRTGISFAAVGLGRFGSALNNFSDESFGGALGYQMFFAKTRQQLILEGGARYATDEIGQRAFALSARYQAAIGRRLVLVLDGFGAYDLARDIFVDFNGDPFDDTFRGGGRLEFLLKL